MLRNVTLLGVGALLALGSLAVALAAPPSALMAVPAPGMHPRVLFTADELPALRAKATTPLGKQFLATLQWQVDYPGKAVLDKLEKGETVPNLDPLSLSDYALWAAAAAKLGDKPEYLDKARAFMTQWAKAIGPPPDKPIPEISRSLHRLALAYDLLYSDLPEDQKALIRAYLAARLDLQANVKAWNTWGWAQGPSFMGRGCDWSAIIAGGCVTACLALEGEHPNASPEMLKAAEGVMQWIADYSLNPDGTTPNGNQYASGDFVSYFMAMRALERRGSALADHPNIREMATWLAYETVPGCYRYDNRNQSSGGMTISPTVAFLAGHFGGLASWVQEQTLSPERRISGDPIGSFAGLVFGVFPDTPPAPPHLPLTRYSSNMGTVYSRSGWTAGSSCFTLTMEPPGQNHTHPDKGSFTFYSHGQVFAADSGVTFFGPEDHNSILVDGKGQQGGQGVTDAVVRAHVASSLADLTWMDVAPAYRQVLAYTETDGQADWSHLVYGKGLPLVWKQVDQLDHFDRFAVYVRGLPEAYAVIVDDIQKDDQPHRYDWLLHVGPPGRIEGGQATFQSRYGGPYIQSETGQKPVRFAVDLPEAREYSIWVLARPWPDLKNAWWGGGFAVNGQGANMWYLGHYCDDWQWVPITYKPERLTRWQLRAGENTFDLTIKRGTRIAQVLLAADPQYTPGSMVTPAEVEASDGGLVLADWDDTKLAPDWSLSEQPDPRPQMTTYFFQPGADTQKLSFAPNFKPRAAISQRLVVTQEGAVSGGFAALLLPSDASEVQPEVRVSPQFGQAAVVRGDYTDYLFANPTDATVPPGRVFTDGKFALVRVKGETIVGYLLAGGKSLKFQGRELVSGSAGTLCLVNDGRQVSLNGPQGAKVTVEGLGAKTVLCNFNPLRAQVQGKKLTIGVPVLPKAWKISFSPDGTVCTVTGDGPRPLKILAPKTINCVVNGVSVYFSRAPGGHIHPKLDDVMTPAWGSDPPEG